MYIIVCISITKEEYIRKTVGLFIEKKKWKRMKIQWDSLLDQESHFRFSMDKGSSYVILFNSRR
jgi:hypothetical protein